MKNKKIKLLVITGVVILAMSSIAYAGAVVSKWNGKQIIEETKNHIIEMNSILLFADQDMGELKERVNKLNDKILELETLLSSMETSNTDLEEQVKNLKAEKIELENQIKDLSNTASEVEILKQELQKANDDVLILQEQVEGSKKLISNLKHIDLGE